MLLQRCSIFLIFLLFYFDLTESGSKYGSSRLTSSGSSRGSLGSSRGSSGSSRGYGSSGSSRGYGSSGSYKPPSSNSGSYGWRKPTSYRTTSKPYVIRTTTRRHYFVTTLPTHKMTTRRSQHYITTLPTRISTTRRPIITTIPTHRTTHTTTRQPAYHPFFTTSKHTTKQPPYNPFFSSSVRPNNAFQTSSSRYNKTGTRYSTTKQPPYNPFFSSSVRPNNAFPTTSSRFNNTGTRYSTTKQPPYNPFFSSSVRPSNTFKSSTSRYNNTGSRFNTTKQPLNNPFYSSSVRPNNAFQTSTSRFNNTGARFNTTKIPSHNQFQITPSRNNGSGNYTTPGSLIRPNNYYNGTGRVTTRPNMIQTTKVTPVGSGINNGRSNFTRPVTPAPNYVWRPTSAWDSKTLPPKKFTGPSWNNTPSRGNFGSGSDKPIYRPPGTHNTTFVSRPSYITGTNPNYNYHTPPVNGGTTIINNNHHHYYPGGGYYQTSTGTISHVTIINDNNYYNPNHHIIIPSRHYYSYGPPAVGISIVNTDYYAHPISSHYATTYHYSTSDTGSTALGFYLGYQLGKITRPSYYYHSTSYVNNEYVPRYDHYTVHHYYHDNQNIPKVAQIQPNAIVVCPGDTGELCPRGNTPLCTNNGAVMCVVSEQSTVPCDNGIQMNCVKSSISCDGNNSPECKQQKETTVSIPCVSTAKIDAVVGVVNNSLLVIKPNDSSTKAFCVTVLALPAQSKNATQNNTISNSSKEYSLPYHYTTNDTGVGLLGYFLGSKLQSLLQPSFFYLNYDNNYNYVDKFDHYDVYHYDHNPSILPQIVEIKKEQLMNCSGDSGTFCPPNTTSLCLYDGSVICATESNSTFNNQSIFSNISCDNLRSPACVSSPNDSISIQIPCISTAKVYAKTSYVIRSYNLGNTIIYYKTFQPFNETVEIPRELCVTILAIPGQKVLIRPPKKRKVTGVKNAINSVSLPKYTYNINGTGKHVFGYYLLYKLGKLSFPTYYWINAYLYNMYGEVQKYDHYSIHYYEHGKEILPNELELQVSDIKGCEGDSGLLCTQNTSSLCLNDGSLWCVTDFMLTKPCTKYNNTACIQTTISCLNNKSPECRNLKVKQIELACEATLTVVGEIMAVNNSIYKSSPLAAKPYVDIKMLPNSTAGSVKAQHFCVTLINIPVERKLSEGEQVFKNSDLLFGNVASKIFGL